MDFPKSHDLFDLYDQVNCKKANILLPWILTGCNARESLLLSLGPLKYRHDESMKSIK